MIHQLIVNTTIFVTFESWIWMKRKLFFTFQARNRSNVSLKVATDVSPTRATARSTVTSTRRTNRTTAKSEDATSRTLTHQVWGNTWRYKTMKSYLHHYVYFVPSSRAKHIYSKKPHCSSSVVEEYIPEKSRIPAGYEPLIFVQVASAQPLSEVIKYWFCWTINLIYWRKMACFINAMRLQITCFAL